MYSFIYARVVFEQRAIEVALYSGEGVEVTVHDNNKRYRWATALIDGRQDLCSESLSGFMQVWNALVAKAVDLSQFPGAKVSVNAFYRNQSYPWVSPNFCRTGRGGG